MSFNEISYFFLSLAAIIFTSGNLKPEIINFVGLLDTLDFPAMWIIKTVKKIYVVVQDFISEFRTSLIKPFAIIRLAFSDIYGFMG